MESRELCLLVTGAMYSTEQIKSDKYRTSRENIYYGEIQYKLCELPEHQMNVTLRDLEGIWEEEVRCVVL